MLVPRPRRTGRLAAAGLLALLCTPVAAAAAQGPPRVADSVGAGGVDLSGLTLDEAAAKLDAQLAPAARAADRRARRRPAASRSRPPTRRSRSTRARPPSGRSRAARPSTTPEAGGTAFGADVPLGDPAFAGSPCRRSSAKVAAGVARAPRDATLRIGIKRMTIRRAKLGVGLDAAALAAKVDAALDAPADVAPGRAAHAQGVPARQRRRPARAVPHRRHGQQARVQAAPVQEPEAPPHVRRRRRAVRPTRRRKAGSASRTSRSTRSGRCRTARGRASSAAAPSPADRPPTRSRRAGWASPTASASTARATTTRSARAASHGCIRMHVADVKRLYPLVPVGTTIIIR